MSSAKAFLDLAARAALRAAGDVEPNPLVGAAIVRDGTLIGLGHHRRFGGYHAEVEAIHDCRRRGLSPLGADMFVTLEPCTHTGKQPPCTDAIIAAGLRRVVIARPDPNHLAAGGAAVLRDAGVLVEFSTASPLAISISDPFVHRIRSGRPWIIAKWAQTIDGRVATRAGASQWISCAASRRRVHRLRARVDAILTAIGTVRADDPRLTARDVPRLRRRARRVVLDARVQLRPDAALVRSISDAPLTVIYDESLAPSRAAPIRTLAAHGVELLPAPADPATGRLDLRAALSVLQHAHPISTLLVEAGPRLLGALLHADLVDEAHAYIAPLLLADEQAVPAASGAARPALADARRFRLVDLRRIGPDALHVYRRSTAPDS